jgi:mediator of RNA polymerase II transcription subunit 5
MLFEYYPGDVVLQAYLKEAIQRRLVSLPTFTATFLLAARSRAVREPVTLSLLCKTIQEAHVWLDPSAAPATLLPEDPDRALGTVRDALVLLRTTYDPLLPAHHFQRVVAPVGDLIMSLTHPTPDFSNASGALALECIQSIRDLLLHAFALDHNLRQPLENLAFTLNLYLGENAGLNPRGSVSNTRSSLGQVDILGPGLESDTTTCSLLLFHLVSRLLEATAWHTYEAYPISIRSLTELRHMGRDMMPMPPRCSLRLIERLRGRYKGSSFNFFSPLVHVCQRTCLM